MREIIGKLQTMRKEAGSEVQDRITVYYGDNTRISGIIERNKELISEEVLADSMHHLQQAKGT